jgi:ribosome recycling factor
MVIVEDFKKETASVLSDLKRELSGIRTNRPSSSLLEDLKVDYYGQILPLKQIGNIGITPPREIHVQVWDKEAVTSVIKAIESSSLGLTPNADGNVVRVFLPELSEERRAEFVKHVKHIAEEHRIKLRHFRDDANKKIQKGLDDGDVNEDQKFKLKEEVQKETDRVNGEIEKMVEAKTKEINE